MWIRMSLVAAVLAVLAWPGAAAAQQPAARDADLLTLERALELARGDNTTLRSVAIDADKVDDRLAAARTRRLPAFNLTVIGSQILTPIDFQFDRGVFGTFDGIGPVPANDTLISTPRQPTASVIGSVTQPLSKLYRIGLDLKLLAIEKEIAREQVRARVQETVSAVKQSYFAILQTQSALESAEATIRLDTELDRLTDEYVAQRVALRSEGLDVKARLARAEYDAVVLRDQLATQKESLNVLLGRDVGTEFRVSEVPAHARFEADLVAARQRALERRPEVNEARLKAEQAGVDRRIKKAERIPEVTLSFDYISLLNYSSFLPRHVATAGVTVKWEVFDWGRKRHELAEKDRAREQAALALRDAEARVVADVNATARKLEQAQRLLRVTALRQEACREGARVATARYEARAALLKDALHARTELVEADAQYQQALLSFWTAKADFERALGEDK
jgi:outer membrane protein